MIAFILGQWAGRVVKKHPSPLKLMKSSKKAPEKVFKSTQMFLLAVENLLNVKGA